MPVSLTEYLTEIQELTKKNFEILKALNDSFYTKSEHLRVNLDNANYVIPSFISLENKLNTLADNFENLVNAPRTGEAVFDFNGNTQQIEVKGFANVPQTAFEGLDMESVAQIRNFNYKKNEIFKDFLTPTPYINIDLSNLADDIQQLNVKKIIVKNEQLVSLLKTQSNWQSANQENNTEESVCRPIVYSDVVKKLYAFEDGKDYVEYDKTYTLPIRYELGTGKYNILEIKNNWTDEDFIEHYELKLDKLTYRIADDTIERNLFVGDYLVTNNDKVKLLIENIYSSSNTIQVKVENGGFADLCTVEDGNVDLSTLKFFAIGNINKSKYLQVPLEEDRYVLVFLAPIQQTSHTQSAWADGLFFDVYALTITIGNETLPYQDFYNNFVTNIGDKLFGLVAMAAKDFVNVGEEEFTNLTTAQPVIDESAIKVVLINKHMSNSDTIAEIYNLYKQKEDYKTELSSVQKQIDEINNLLSSLSFEDTTTSRTIYTDQLSELNEKRKELTSAIADCIRQITVASTDTDTPVENPKYHIRGFFDYEKFLKENNWIDETGKHLQDVIKIEVQYRYKNANRTTGNAETIGENGDVFSDWNIMDSFINVRRPVFNDGAYKYELEGDTSKLNIPSFNQIDIPISQGETVDARLRVVYEIGYPFVKTVSAWSEIVNVAFPVELKKNITVLDILKENNSDTTKEAFRGYLEKYGVTDHVSDKLVDQNITYFHQPEHIASGFYTEERRVIPLRDKLQTLTDDIVTLRDEVFGTATDNLLVTLSDGEQEIIVSPFANNTFVMKDFASADKITPPSATEMEKVETTLTIKIQNNSKNSAIRLFSMFPGNYNETVTQDTQSKFNTTDIVTKTHQSSIYGLCIPLYLDSRNKYTPFTLQVQNQWVYFRINDAFNASELAKISDGDYITGTRIVGYHENYDITNAIKSNIYPTFFDATANHAGGMCAFPHLSDIKDICITNNDASNCKMIYPGESVEIPLNVMYSLKDGDEVSKIMEFDLRTSLYTDPLNYKFELKAKYSNSLANNARKLKRARYNPVVIN
jgi:hypothetical protein